MAKAIEHPEECNAYQSPISAYAISNATLRLKFRKHFTSFGSLGQSAPFISRDERQQVRNRHDYQTQLGKRVSCAIHARLSKGKVVEYSLDSAIALKAWYSHRFPLDAA